MRDVCSNKLFLELLIDELKLRLGPGEERGGFVLDTGELVEAKNISTDPENAFQPSGLFLLKYCDSAIATWHTQPEASSQLSVTDFRTFLAWPDLKHFVVGTNGVSIYEVVAGKVLRV